MSNQPGFPNPQTPVPPPSGNPPVPNPGAPNPPQPAVEAPKASTLDEANRDLAVAALSEASSSHDLQVLWNLLGVAQAQIDWLVARVVGHSSGEPAHVKQMAYNAAYNKVKEQGERVDGLPGPSE